MQGELARMLFILGEVEARQPDGTMTRAVRGSDLRKLLDDGSYDTLCLSRSALRRLPYGALDDYEVIANLITEPVNNARMLESLSKLLRRNRARVINPPDAIIGSTREKVARRLQGIDNLMVPTTALLRVGGKATVERLLGNAGLVPPVIIRRPGTHRGESLQFCETMTEASSALAKPGAYVATQFIDFRSADGLYRKYRVFFIGRHQILRHLLISESWNVHADTRFDFMASRSELIEEERTLFEREFPFSPQVQAVLDAVQERMPLDFFGMDFGLTGDGRVVLFEANATMSFMPNLVVPHFEHLTSRFLLAQQAFRDLLGLTPQTAKAPIYQVSLPTG
jgi:hypothetical protein